VSNEPLIAQTVVVDVARGMDVADIRARPSTLRAVLSAIRTDPTMALSTAFIAALVVVAILAPWIAPYDPNAQQLADRLSPPAWLYGGGSEHLLGTDNLGRDVLSRLIYGSRVSLLVGFLVTLIAGTFGILMGLIAGYRRGTPERLIMGWIDMQVSFPVILLIILVITVVGPSVPTLIVCISLTTWLIFARTTRAAVLSVARAAYIDAAETSGCSTSRILLKHILPNLVSPLATLAVLEFASVILVEAALSFLGIGVQPPVTSWGLDVSIGKEYIFNAWWLVAFPGLAIAATVLALNLISSSMRTAMDPTSRAIRVVAREQRRQRRRQKVTR